MTHVSNDSTQLSDQHYAAVRRLRLQGRDGSRDRACPARTGQGERWAAHLSGKCFAVTPPCYLTAMISIISPVRSALINAFLT